MAVGVRPLLWSGRRLQSAVTFAVLARIRKIAKTEMWTPGFAQKPFAQGVNTWAPSFRVGEEERSSCSRSCPNTRIFEARPP